MKVFWCFNSQVRLRHLHLTPLVHLLLTKSYQETQGTRLQKELAPSLGDQCDTANDCPNGEDESVELCVAGFTQCLNNGTRVDDVINFCNCSDRYDGVLCETDLGAFRLRFVFYVNIMHEHQENTQRP